MRTIELACARVGPDGFCASALGEPLPAPDWGAHAGARSPLAAAVRSRLAHRNPRLGRLDAGALAALLAADLVLCGPAAVPDPGELFLRVRNDGGPLAADAAFWASAAASGPALASPMLFAATLPSTVAGELAMTFGLSGAGLVVCAGAPDLLPAEVVAPGRHVLDVELEGFAPGGPGTVRARLLAPAAEDS